MKHLHVLLFFFITITLPAQNTIKGVVYEDTNGNGRKDRKEVGIANVAVSNGYDVVLTDTNGKYNIEIDNDNIIFVIKPTGYKILSDEFNLPKSHYIHKPEGSPKLIYEGVLPTGILAESLEFSLIKSNEPDDFSAFVFGDTQVYFDEEVDYLKRGIIDEAKNKKGISFGISLGDLVGDNLSLHPPYKQAIKGMNLQWYNVMGNHDMNYDVKSDSLSDETFERNFGPANYSFNYGKSHFIVLDNILYPNPVTGKGYIAGLREDQFKFFENDLRHVSPDQLIVLCMHIPLLDKKNRKAFREPDRQRIYKLLEKYPNVLVLTAHTHIQYHNLIGAEEGLKRDKPIHEYNVGTTCGDWYSGELNEKGIPISTMRDGTPKGYAILNIQGNKYTLDYKVADRPDNYQLSIYNPKVVPYNGRSTYSIYVNFFMGSDSDTVEYRIDNGRWKKMTMIDDYDPAYYKYMQDWDFATEVKQLRRPSNAQKCRHLWFSKIPSKLPVGKHIIEVRATDMFGRTFTQTSSYEIKEYPSPSL